MVNAIKGAGQESSLKAVTTHTYLSAANGQINTVAPVWFSEQCDLNGQWSTAWTGGGAGAGLTWANNIMDAIMNHNAGGYLYWEGVQWPNPNTNVSSLSGLCSLFPYGESVDEKLLTMKIDDRKKSSAWTSKQATTK